MSLKKKDITNYKDYNPLIRYEKLKASVKRKIDKKTKKPFLRNAND